MVETTEATAYGEQLNTSPRLKHQYTGESWEAEAGQTYLRARWCDPDTGQMSSIDPFAGQFTGARSLKRYAYAEGDAANNIDPSGEMSLAEVGAGLNIQSKLASLSLFMVSRSALEQY